MGSHITDPWRNLVTASLKRRIAVLGAAATFTCSPLLVSAPVDAAAALTCRASMSDSTPDQYSNVTVRVKTAPRAQVRTVAHYRTTDTAKSKRANSAGKANLVYYISSATAGYRVKVDVKVTKNGQTKTCSTSFTPHS